MRLLPLFHRKAQDGLRAVALSRAEEGGGELGLVGAVGEVLGLEAEAAPLRVGALRLAAEASVEEVAGVELDAGLGGEDLEDAARLGFEDAGGEDRLGAGGAWSAVEDEVVVVAVTELELGIRLVDVLADGFGAAEVEGGACDGEDLSAGDEVPVDGGEAASVELEDMAEDVTLAFALEVEVAVLAQVDGGGLVGLGLVEDVEFVAFLEFVADPDLEVAGVAFFAVLGEVAEDDVPWALFFDLPEDAVETAQAAVEVVGAVVGGEGVAPVADAEAALGDAVGVAADDGAEVGVVGGVQVVLGLGEAEDDVGGLALPVRDLEREDDGAEVGDPDAHAGGVLEGEGLHRGRGGLVGAGRGRSAGSQEEDGGEGKGRGEVGLLHFFWSPRRHSRRPVEAPFCIWISSIHSRARTGAKWMGLRRSRWML